LKSGGKQDKRMIGETLNEYRITATIGVGGMGEVIPLTGPVWRKRWRGYLKRFPVKDCFFPL
jgi:hypothetical protein